MYDLVVVRPFGDHNKGDIITDLGAVNKILGSEDEVNVRRITKREE